LVLLVQSVIVQLQKKFECILKAIVYTSFLKQSSIIMNYCNIVKY